MSIHANRKRVVVPIAAISAGVLLASALGVSTRVNAAPDPGKASAGPFGTITIDPPDLGGAFCFANFYAAPGVKVGDHVLVQAPYDLASSLVSHPVTQTLSDNLIVRICNIDDTNNVDDGAKTWTYMVLR